MLSETLNVSAATCSSALTARSDTSRSDRREMFDGRPPVANPRTTPSASATTVNDIRHDGSVRLGVVRGRWVLMAEDELHDWKPLLADLDDRRAKALGMG